MNKLTKTLLISGIVMTAIGSLFAGGIIQVNGATGLHVLFPTGVILLGLTLISKMLEKESLRYDQEHAAVHPEPATPDAQPRKKNGNHKLVAKPHSA